MLTWDIDGKRRYVNLKKKSSLPWEDDFSNCLWGDNILFTFLTSPTILYPTLNGKWHDRLKSYVRWGKL